MKAYNAKQVTVDVGFYGVVFNVYVDPFFVLWSCVVYDIAFRIIRVMMPVMPGLQDTPKKCVFQCPWCHT
eukprot:c28835_g1_i1 orf=1-210(+)